MNSQTAFSKAIIGKALTFSLALCLTGSSTLFTTTANAADFSTNINAAQDGSSYSASDLDNLLAPIALYPDSLLAQVLVAATFDDQIQDASQVLSAGAVAIDDQPWDDSVKAVAHYPKVLFTLAAQPDWTSALGQAYVAQSTDVMNSIQRLRAMALSQGNLVSTTQQRVVATSGVIQILPARAGFMFLPSYGPNLAFSAPAFVSFGPALAIDASSDDQIDWHEHHIFDRHHDYARTGNRGSRDGFRRVRGLGRDRFNSGRNREGFKRIGYNPGSGHEQMNHGQTDHGQMNRGQVNRGEVNRGQMNHSQMNRGDVNRGQLNHGQMNHGDVNRGQFNAGANHNQMNRQNSAGVSHGQTSHALVNTAMNRSAGGRPTGRNRR
jgi:Protein of unknown function (DUF3300)/Pentapeptide repeats (8 copies)